MLNACSRTLRAVSLVCLLWFVTGCSDPVGENDRSPANGLAGRMLLWHAWDETDTVYLQDELARFAQIHPDVTIRTQAFASQDELYARFLRASDAGLGPDLLFAPHEWIRQLAERKLIQPIDEFVDPSMRDRYMPAALSAMSFDERLYGLPESVNTSLLFYKKSQIETPPATLTDLLREANQGHAIALSTHFPDAGWGIRAFGGKMFDDAGNIIVDRGGFTNWLAWLKNAGEQPGIILDRNHGLLRQRFIDDASISYFVGDFYDLAFLRQTMGDDAVAPAILPSGPNGSAGPFLHVNGLLFSGASSPSQQRIALEFATFLTNAEQSANLMRAAQRVPANVDVRINPRLEPELYLLTNQARAAITVPNWSASDQIFALVDEAFYKVLEGVIEAPQAAVEVTARLQSDLGIETVDSESVGCTDFGPIRLLTTWTNAELSALNTIILRYAQQCPAAKLLLTQTSPEELLSQAGANAELLSANDLFLGSQATLNQLARAEQVQPLDGLADLDLLQRFWPEALEAMRVDRSLYGIPMILDVDSLYFNRTMVSQPALTLADLKSEAEIGVPIVFAGSFAANFWQISAFGGQLPDAELALAVGSQPWVEALQWLAEGVEAGTISLVDSEPAAMQRFIAGDSAYLVGGPQLMPGLIAELGSDVIGVTPLPAGPIGDAAPLLHAEGFMLTAAPETTEAARALRFAVFATNASNQQWLATIASRVPANATTDLSEINSVIPFLPQLSTVTVWPNLAEERLLLTVLERVYQTVLMGSSEAEEALRTAQRTLGLAPLSVPEEGEPTDEP